MIGHGWKKTIELDIGDRIETDGSDTMMVTSVIDEKRQDLTYNFTVADFHSYYVTKRNVLVHNCGNKAKNALVGDKLKTPDSNPGDFNNLGGNQGLKNKKSGEIWQKSNTNHSGDELGEYKVGVGKNKAPTPSKKITVKRSTCTVSKRDGC